MPKFELPRAAALAEIPRQIRLQIVSPGAEPPEGDGWLHEIKHDGHRLLAIINGEALKLLSRNGRDRTALFREPFRPLIGAGLPRMVLDGEITVPDERELPILTRSARQYPSDGLSSSRSSPSISCISMTTTFAAAPLRQGRSYCAT
jgi:hypothetical protein